MYYRGLGKLSFFVIPTLFDEKFQILSFVSVGHTRKQIFVI